MPSESCPANLWQVMQENEPAPVSERPASARGCEIVGVGAAGSAGRSARRIHSASAPTFASPNCGIRVAM
jgi:hypothetical protein